MAKDLKNLCAYELGYLLESKKLDPISLLEYYISIYRSNDNNIKSSFVNLMISKAKNEAMRSWRRQKEGRRKGILDGIPMAWKDMIDIEQNPAFAGSKKVYNWRKNAQVRDATVVRLAKNAGLISLAKTGTVELAFGGIGTNRYNPLPKIIIKNKEFAAGGSSTGSATAVSNNLVPLAIGTDTAGSVRIPAAWNNLVGFKPSLGKVSTKGILPLSKSYDTVGIISKCVKDIQLVYDIFTKRESNHYSIEDNKIKAMVVVDFTLEKLENKNKSKFYEIFNKFVISGIELEYLEIPEFNEINQYISENGSIVNYDAWRYWNKIFKGNISGIDPNVQKRLILGRKLKKQNKLKIEDKLKYFKKVIGEKTKKYDVLMFPTLSMHPPAMETLKKPVDYNVANIKVLNNTRIANIINMCAISIPIILKRHNWLSLSILARSGEEKKLLSIAEKCENIINL